MKLEYFEKKAAFSGNSCRILINESSDEKLFLNNGRSSLWWRRDGVKSLAIKADELTFGRVKRRHGLKKVALLKANAIFLL